MATTNADILNYLRDNADLNGGTIEKARMTWDGSPGPMYRDVAAVRIEDGNIDFLVYVKHDGSMDFEEVEFPRWPPRSF